ncbi:potassium channel family protein [Paraburkholderia nemoris]|uniref:potassium channel family protein n=1 Tax=Paraburkholderia nemoris TaxID=2793076 RepID=UPI002E2807D7|nr:potassium channel family protein [Paraburkholderia nemoris]
MIRIKVRRGRTHTLEQQVAFFRLPKRRCHERAPDGIGVAIERCNLGGVGEMNDGFRVAGLGGVDPHDDARAVRTWRWLQWILFGASLLAIPAFYLELAVDSPMLHQMGRALYVCMVAGFAVSLAWMVHLSHKPKRFLMRNRYDVLIAIGAATSIAWGVTPWSSLEWVLRILFMGLVAARIVVSLRGFFTPNRLFLLLVTAAVLLASAGAGFYWLEPGVHTYAEGVWLAFESSATVGYGDMAPTTPASRVFAAFVVLLGYGLLSLVFASIAAIFVEQEERLLRREMHRDIKTLQAEIASLRREVGSLGAKAHDDEGPVERDPTCSSSASRTRSVISRVTLAKPSNAPDGS